MDKLMAKPVELVDLREIAPSEGFVIPPHCNSCPFLDGVKPGKYMRLSVVNLAGDGRTRLVGVKLTTGEERYFDPLLKVYPYHLDITLEEY